MVTAIVGAASRPGHHVVDSGPSGVPESTPRSKQGVVVLGVDRPTHGVVLVADLAQSGKAATGTWVQVLMWQRSPVLHGVVPLVPLVTERFSLSCVEPEVVAFVPRASPIRDAQEHRTRWQQRHVKFIRPAMLDLLRSSSWPSVCEFEPDEQLERRKILHPLTIVIGEHHLRDAVHHEHAHAVVTHLPPPCLDSALRPFSRRTRPTAR